MAGAAKYQPYPAYKPSGVEWLGDIPEGWGLEPCRANVNHHMDKNSDGKFENYLSLMANVGVIPYAEKGDVGNKKPDDLTKCKIVRVGDLVINSMNYAIGSYGMSPYDGVCSPVYIILSAKPEKLHKRFALRVFENKPFQKHLAVFGNGILEHRAAIGWDTIKGQYIPVPTLKEQKVIISFLDHETSKIDALIAKQERLIALLEEKRQAVISHAVTKGLDPTAPLRPSGIDWLGDVPAHWEVKQLKFLCSAIGTGSTPKEQGDLSSDGDLPWFTPGDFDGQLGLNRATKWLKNASLTKGTAKQFSKGSVLIVGIGATLGKIAVCERPFSGNQQINVATPNHQANVYFLASALDSQLEQMKTVSNSATIGIMNQEKTGSIMLAAPPYDEQLQIANFISNKAKSFAVLNRKVDSAITLLKERRTALISAAVTGKIDLRGWEVPSDATDSIHDKEVLA